MNQPPWQNQPPYGQQPWYNQPTQLAPGQFQQPPYTPVLATCGIRRPELAYENPSCCLLRLADSSEEEYHLKH
jgi:hypothetical protein